MKAKLLWIGVLLLGLSACNENKGDESEARAIPERSPSTAGGSSSLKPTRAVPPRPNRPETFVVEETLTETEVVEESVAGALTPAPEEMDARQVDREAQQAEREARRAEQREQRVAQFTEQMTTRLKEQDADGDGLLSKEEVSGRMQRRFDSADADGDGYLDSSEQETMIQETTERMSNFNRDRGGRGFGGGGRGFGGGGQGRRMGGGR